MKKPIEVALTNETVLIAHRGLSGIAPENTLEAFTLAGKYGYYGTECDIHVTRDNHFVVFHDFTLERMTGKKGFIKDLTVEEIKQLNIISGNGIDEYEHVKIPLLQEYLDICIAYDMIPVIEIKDIRDMRDLDRLMVLLKEKKMVNKAHVISFRLEYLIYLRQKERDLTIYLLAEEITEQVISICNNYHFNVDTNANNLTEKGIIACHKSNILVNTYTVDDPLIAQKLSDAKIDFITTNILYEKV